MSGQVVAYTQGQHPAPASSWRGIVPHDFESQWRMAKAIAISGMAPKSYYENGNDAAACCFTAIQLGGEVGLTPMASVQNIAIINGKPGLYGPGQLAVVRASGLLADIDEGVRGEGEKAEGFCTVVRKGERARTFVFTWAQAKRANLIGKSGPWTAYPERMLLARARTFALRDVFPDVLLGLAYTVEELRDMPLEDMRDVTPPAPQKASSPDPSPPSDDPPGQDAQAPEAQSPKPVPTIEVVTPDGEVLTFARNWDGALAILDTIERHGAGAVMLNNAVMDRIAGRFPELADRVSGIRERAAEDLTPATDEAADDIAEKMRVRRGGAPSDDGGVDAFGLKPLPPEDDDA